MGLDAVELVLSVEDRFNVRLFDAEYSRAYTVADLAALVVSRLPKGTGGCPTSRAFFHVRNLLQRHASTEPRRVRPRTRLDELFPEGHRRVWRRLRGWDRRLPRLELSDPARAWLGAVFGIGGVAAGVTVGLNYGVCAAIGALGAVAVVYLLVAGAFRRQFPAKIQTVGDLARKLVPVEMPQDSGGGEAVMRSLVLNEVRRMTAEILGMPLEKVLPESRFVQDLGMG